MQRTPVLLLGLAALLAAAAPVRAAARSEAMELEDKERAQVAKETLKHKRSGQASKGSGGDKGCGSVDIGNESDAKGSDRIAGRQKTVIVTGNVYNTANCKR